jgi:hypothetical protein
MSVQTFDFAKEAIYNTRGAMGHYMNDLSNVENRKDIKRLLQTKKVLDNVRQYAMELAHEKEVSVTYSPVMEDTFVPQIEEEMNFDLQFEEIELPKEKTEEVLREKQVEHPDLLSNKSEYIGVSVALRDPSLSQKIEMEGLKETKKENGSIVDYAKKTAAAKRITKQKLGLGKRMENGLENN